MSSATQSQNAHTPSTTASSNDNNTAEDQLWEGEKMFNIYIWDYCTKRGYTNTARELTEEAKLGPSPRPPIDAKQGLLYEWWSVFWVLFSAKSNNSGSDDAMLYMHSHMQSRMQQVPPGMSRYPNGIRGIPGATPGAPGMPTTVPGHVLPGAAPMSSVAHAQHPGQPPNVHSMPNGIGTAAVNQQTAQGGPQAQQSVQQQQTPLGFPVIPNGVPPTAPGRPMPGQTGRAPQGAVPFFSPTMGHMHTPAGAAAGPPPPYPGPNIYQQTQQQLRPGMPPPGTTGAQAPPNGVQGGAINAGSPGYNQGGSGSRAPTPAQGQPGLTNPSPNMAHHTVPQTPPNFGGVPAGRGPPFEQQMADLQKIDPQVLNELRAELGFGNKDISSLTFDEKNRLLHSHRNRVSAGPSNQARNQAGGRGSKRNSISPGDDQQEVSVKSEASPPANKRVRRSPEQPAPPTAGSSNNASMPMGGMYTQPNMRGNMFGPPMGGVAMAPGPQPVNAQSQQKMGQQINHQYHANMQNIHRLGSTNAPMSAVTNIGDSSSSSSDQMTFTQDGGQQRSGPPLFATGMNPQRPVQGSQQNKPMMPPPSSPAANGAKPPQAQTIQGKVDGTKPESSPQSVPQGTPSTSAGTSGPSPAPPTSGQTSVSSPSLAHPSRPPTATSNPTTATSLPTPGIQPASIPPPPASAPPGPADQLTAGFDFMSTGFDDFTSMFGRNEETVDFEREFSTWFTPDMILDATK